MEWDSFEGKIVVNLRLFCERHHLVRQYFGTNACVNQILTMYLWTVCQFWVKRSFGKMELEIIKISDEDGLFQDEKNYLECLDSMTVYKE